METIAISKFKATCLQLLDRIRKTGESLVVTKKGTPIALVSPPPPPPKKSSFGAMKGKIKIHGDITKPLPEKDWEALRS